MNDPAMNARPIPDPAKSTAEPDVVRVNLNSRSYDIRIVSGNLDDCGATITHWHQTRHPAVSKPRALVVADQNVLTPHAQTVLSSLQAAGWICELAEVPPGEVSKRLVEVSTLYDRLADMKADRNTVVIAVGGGVIGDMAGFLAATWTRGVPFIQIPTTLLAHVDSSVGGKVGVNHPRGKNLIGAFHQPVGVFIDTETLNTLPDREYRSGLAEVIKYGVILDADFFGWLEHNVTGLNDRVSAIMRSIIRRSCELKANVVEQDEYERTGIRAALNYGHTFAHAFETLSDYSQLLHGEAVSIGMICASRLAERLGMISAEITERQIALLRAVQLPTTIPNGYSTDALVETMKLDKKVVDGQLRFVLPTRLGQVKVAGSVNESDVRAVLGSPTN